MLEGSPGEVPIEGISRAHAEAFRENMELRWER